MEYGETTVVDSHEIETENIKESLIGICMDLDERGYNSIKQIVAYLISGEPGYISSYKECRNRLLRFKREDIIEIMLTGFIKE
ncbi:MAG: IreB family regulatory phosphoprotein [Bacilli bacterium]